MKITNFIEICYFHISQTKSSLYKIFYKVVYHHIINMCDFFGEFRRFFCHDLHEFSRRLWFALDTFPLLKGPIAVNNPINMAGEIKSFHFQKTIFLGVEKCILSIRNNSHQTVNRVVSFRVIYRWLYVYQKEKVFFKKKSYVNQIVIGK